MVFVLQLQVQLPAPVTAAEDKVQDDAPLNAANAIEAAAGVVQVVNVNAHPPSNK